jgi:uncharacterized protein
VAVGVLAPLPLIITANAAIGRRWAHLAIGVLAGLSAGATFLVGALDLAVAGTSAGSSSLYSPPVDVGFMATALIAATLASKPVRERITPFLAIDPDNPVHSLALVLAAILFGTNLSVTLLTDPTTSSQPALSLGDLLAQELSLVVLAAAGVGALTRRNLSQAATRLGLVVPTWWQIVLAVAAGGAFFAFGVGMVSLSHLLTPELARQLDTSTQHLFGGLDNPIGIAALALGPGICEEILFRGALQPRLGLVATAVLFTSIHTQYGLSLDLFSVFVIAVGLGLVRKYTNTTTSAISHVIYNLLIGIGIAASQVEFAVALEAVLIAVAAYAIWSNRRRPAVPANP